MPITPPLFPPFHLKHPSVYSLLFASLCVAEYVEPVPLAIALVVLDGSEIMSGSEALRLTANLSALVRQPVRVLVSLPGLA